MRESIPVSSGGEWCVLSPTVEDRAGGQHDRQMEQQHLQGAERVLQQARDEGAADERAPGEHDSSLTGDDLTHQPRTCTGIIQE